MCCLRGEPHFRWARVRKQLREYAEGRRAQCQLLQEVGYLSDAKPSDRQLKDISTQSSPVQSNPFESIVEAKESSVPERNKLRQQNHNPNPDTRRYANTQILSRIHPYPCEGPCESTITTQPSLNLNLNLAAKTKISRAKCRQKTAKTTQKTSRLQRSRVGPNGGRSGLGSRDAFLQAFHSPERFAKCSEIRNPTNQRAFLHTTKRAKQELFSVNAVV